MLSRWIIEKPEGDSRSCASAHRYVSPMPDGHQTVLPTIGFDGTGLSNGTRVRPDGLRGSPG